MNVKEWLQEWFEKNTDVSKEKIEKSGGENYLLGGWIDSFKFITLISEIEEKYGIRFSNDEFQDRSFGTIDGMSKAIQKKVDEK